MSTSKATFDWSNFIFKIDGLFCLFLEFLFHFPFDQFASAHCTIGQGPDYCPLLLPHQANHSDCADLLILLMLLGILNYPVCSFSHVANLENLSWLLSCTERQQRPTGADNFHWYPWHMDMQTFHTPSDFAIGATRSACKYLNKDHH